MTDLIRRLDAIQACQVGPSDEWSRATKDGYNQAATDCQRNILRIEPAPNAVAVKVKPLVWDDDGYGNFRAQSVRGGEGVDRLTEPQVIEDDKVTYEAWGIDGAFETPEFAQAAVEAEVALEILDAIELTPDPRDAVIARLVEVLTDTSAILQAAMFAGKVKGADQYRIGGVYLQNVSDTLDASDAALAAAKEVMR